MSVDKYKELYQYSKEAYQEELNRFYRIDEKTFKLLSLLTVFIGLYGFLVRWLASEILPPNMPIDWFLIGIALITLSFFIFAGFFMFNAIKLQDVKKYPLTDDFFDFYIKHDMIDIYYALSKGAQAALNHNKGMTDKKLRLLTDGYWRLIYSGFSVIILIILILAREWISP